MIRLIEVNRRNPHEPRRLFDQIIAADTDELRDSLGVAAAFVSSKEPNRDVDESDVVDGAFGALLWVDADIFRFDTDSEVFYFNGPIERIVATFEGLLKQNAQRKLAKGQPS